MVHATIVYITWHIQRAIHQSQLSGSFWHEDSGSQVQTSSGILLAIRDPSSALHQEADTEKGSKAPTGHITLPSYQTLLTFNAHLPTPVHASNTADIPANWIGDISTWHLERAFATSTEFYRAIGQDTANKWQISMFSLSYEKLRPHIDLHHILQMGNNMLWHKDIWSSEFKVLLSLRNVGVKLGTFFLGHPSYKYNTPIFGKAYRIPAGISVSRLPFSNSEHLLFSVHCLCLCVLQLLFCPPKSSRQSGCQ